MMTFNTCIKRCRVVAENKKGEVIFPFFINYIEIGLPGNGYHTIT
jgi:hypothetical protein